MVLLAKIKNILFCFLLLAGPAVSACPVFSVDLSSSPGQFQNLPASPTPAILSIRDSHSPGPGPALGLCCKLAGMDYLNRSGYFDSSKQNLAHHFSPVSTLFRLNCSLLI